MQLHALNRSRVFLFLGVLAASLLIATALGGEEPARPRDIPAVTILDTDNLPRLVFPILDARRGRKLFAAKGCVICHEISGVGGRSASKLDAVKTITLVNPFDFAARMWLGSAKMAELQEKELGYRIFLAGQDLADLAAFAYDRNEQKKLTIHDVPVRIREMMRQHRL